MKKFSLLSLILVGLVTCANLSAFEHIYELKAIYAALQKRAGQIKPNKKQEVLEVACLKDILENNKPSTLSKETMELYQCVLFYVENFPCNESVLIYGYYLKASNDARENALEVVKEEICKWIRNQDSEQAEEIIANSKFLSNKQSSSSSSSSSVMPTSQVGTVMQVQIPSPSTAFTPRVSVAPVSTQDDRSQEHVIGERSLNTQKLQVLKNGNQLYNSGFSSLHRIDIQPVHVTPDAPSNFGKYVKSAAALLAAGGFYGASLTEVAKRDPRIEKASKVLAGLSALYSVYNALTK